MLITNGDVLCGDVIDRAEVRGDNNEVWLFLKSGNM